MSRFCKSILQHSFLRVRFGQFDCLIQNDLYRISSDEWWHDFCARLLSEEMPGEVLKQGTYKTLLKCTIGSQQCIVKKYRIPGVLRQLRTLVIPSRPRQEFLAGCFINSQGILTAAPLLLVERRRYGLVREGLVAMPFIEDALELRDFLFSSGIASGERYAVARMFGRLTAEIFKKGIFQYDYALNNFLIRKEGEKWQLYFIDFEKVLPRKQASCDQKLDVLSRLNRVGRQVSIRERLQFARGYYEQDPDSAQSRQVFIRRLHHATIVALRADLARSRATSIYTHARYLRIDSPQHTGLYKKEYHLDDIMRICENLTGNRVLHEVVLKGRSRTVTLKVLMANRDKIQRAWAMLNVFVVAGAGFDLPEFFLCDRQRGCIGFEASALQTDITFLTSPSPVQRFLQTHFPNELHWLLLFLTQASNQS